MEKAHVENLGLQSTTQRRARHDFRDIRWARIGRVRVSVPTSTARRVLTKEDFEKGIEERHPRAKAGKKR